MLELNEQRRIPPHSSIDGALKQESWWIQSGWYQVCQPPPPVLELIFSSTGQIPNIGPFQLIDRDTPESAYTHTSYETGETWDLVFSDEFNNPGRTFWPGGESRSTISNRFRLIPR